VTAKIRHDITGKCTPLLINTKLELTELQLVRNSCVAKKKREQMW